MERAKASTDGLQSLIKEYRNVFRIPENLNHYSEEDYKIAEKRFVKYALLECRLGLRHQEP